MSQQFDVCVIGAGPGGYVAAIRSAQLGLNTAIIEREYLGGVCLNVGCIPSKAMISAAHFLHKAEQEAQEMGMEMGPIRLDMKKLVSWKQSVCDKMSSGVSQLLRGNKVTLIKGEADFKSSTEISVKSSQGGRGSQPRILSLPRAPDPLRFPAFQWMKKMFSRPREPLLWIKFQRSLPLSAEVTSAWKLAPTCLNSAQR